MATDIKNNDGDWQYFRYDINHTGFQKTYGKGNLSEYGIIWVKEFKNQYDYPHNLIYGEPAVKDIDFDGEKEIIFGLEDGNLYCLTPKGEIKWKYITDGIISSTPTLININNDKNLEIVFSDRSGNVNVLSSIGRLIWSYQTGEMIDASAAVGDIIGDGELEIVIGGLNNNIFVLNKEGELIWKYDTGNWVEGSAIIADINYDNKNEIIVGNGDGVLYAITTIKEIKFENIPQLRRIEYKPEVLWQFETKQVDNIGFINSPLATDLNDDDRLEIICGAADGNIYCLNNDGKKMWNYNSQKQIYVTPAIADINRDNILEIIFGSDNTLIAIDANGNLLWKKEFDMRITTNPVIFDLNGDGYLEITSIDEDMIKSSPGDKKKLFGNSTNILNHNGEIVYKLPFIEKIYDHIYGVSVVDLDNDSKLEILVGTNFGYLYCYGEVKTSINNNNNNINNDKPNNNNHDNDENKLFSFELTFILIAIFFHLILLKKKK
jgi:outer membrane protein assembly factor BamB